MGTDPSHYPSSPNKVGLFDSNPPTALVIMPPDTTTANRIYLEPPFWSVLGNVWWIIFSIVYH